MDKITVAKGTVEEAMMIPLYEQAYCAEHFGDTFPDDAAKEAIGRIDYDFGSIQFKDIAVLPDVLRIRMIAACIGQYLEVHPNATVVDLECGIDTLFAMVDNGTCSWVNIDRPDVIAFREKVLPNGPRERNIACSIFDPAWFDQVDMSLKDGLLFVANDVFGPVKPEAVQLLCVSLAEEFPGAALCFTAVNETGQKRTNKAAAAVGNREVRFAVDDATTLLHSWSNRFTEVQDLNMVPADVLKSKSIPLSSRLILFSGSTTGTTKIVTTQFRYAKAR